MRRRLPPLNALLVFEAAARHCSFTRAAEELSIAQPAVTRHIAKVEDWVGAPLFTRRGNILELTENGRLLSELSTAAYDRLELGLRGLRRVERRELVIGASFGVAHLWVMPRIGRMRAAAKTDINVVTSDDYRAFDQPDVDLSIRFGDGDFGINEADLLFEEQCQIIASPSFFERNPKFDPENLARTVQTKQMLDHGDPNGIGWMSWRTWYEMGGEPLPQPEYFLEVQSYPTMLDMVLAGEGVSIGTFGIEADLIAAGDLVCVGEPRRRDGFGYYLVYDAELCRSQSFAKLRAHLVETTQM
ncbi:MAG: LysR family transcriptional regulator [Pseudomonadota bacterium]